MPKNVALKLDLCSLVCVNYPFMLFSFRFMHAHLHHTVTHALYVALVFCHGKPEDPYHIFKMHTWGTAPPNVQVRRDDFPGSRVRKRIHTMHRISISSWHRNGHIVPAFVTYHINALHFA